MTTLALTDRDTVAGTVRFAKAAAAADIRPVFGVDVAVAPITPPGPAAGRPRTPVRGGAHVVEPPLRITLFAQTPAGWAGLCRLVSAAHAATDGGMPVVSWPVLREFAEPTWWSCSVPAPNRSGPCPPAVPTSPSSCSRRGGSSRESGCGWRPCIWAGRAPVRARWGWPRTVGLADELGVPVVLSNAVRYADPVQHRLADVLDAARLLRPVDRRRLDGGERWL